MKLKNVFKKKNISKRKLREDGESGFTFAETLAVLAIAAVMAGGAGASTVKLVEQAKITRAKEEIVQYKTALESYYVDSGKFPSSQQGLEALWKKPVLTPVPAEWNGPYVDREIQRDPWGNEYVYIHKGSGTFPSGAPDNLPFVILSYGSDGQKGGDGKAQDIVSWK